MSKHETSLMRLRTDKSIPVHNRACPQIEEMIPLALVHVHIHPELGQSRISLYSWVMLTGAPAVFPAVHLVLCVYVLCYLIISFFCHIYIAIICLALQILCSKNIRISEVLHYFFTAWFSITSIRWFPNLFLRNRRVNMFVPVKSRTALIGQVLFRFGCKYLLFHIYLISYFRNSKILISYHLNFEKHKSHSENRTLI